MKIDNNPDVSLETINLTTNQDITTVSNITRLAIQNNQSLLKVLINDFIKSNEYQEMLDVDLYYKFENKNITNRTKQMELVEEKELIKDGKVTKQTIPYLTPDLSKANHKIAHGYLYELINQCKNYLAGRPIKLSWKEGISEDIKETIDDILYKYNDWGNFNQENVKNAQKYVKSWFRLVVNDKCELKLKNVNSKEVIPFFNDMDELTCIIRIYEQYEYNANTRKVLCKYAEVYDDTYKDVYKSVSGKQYELIEPEVPLLEKITQYGDLIEESEALSWGKIPWVYWEFNKDKIDALQPIRCFIDILDLDISDLANNIDDIQDAVWILENYQGQSIQQFMEDLKIKKALNVGEDGKAHPETTEIPTEARMKLYDTCTKNIYKFGRGLDFSDRTNLGNASGVALKWGYGPLDEKADELEQNGHAALNDLFNLLFTYLKAIGKIPDTEEFDSNILEFVFDRTMIVNEKEQVEMVEASTDIVSQKTALENHPFVDDVEDELERLKDDEMTGVKTSNPLDEEVDEDDDIDESEETEQENKEDKSKEEKKSTKKSN